MEALAFGLAPTPLSLWHAPTASARCGLLLGIATSPQRRIDASCEQLFGIIDRFT
jgi:GntR family transcriptional regulator / MocR family aminotransferase